MKKEHSALIKLTLSMVIFGTIGIFRNLIPCSSPMLAFIRGAVGSVFIILVMLIGRKKLSARGIKKDLPLLLISGALIGANWILLFEAYRFTTVATATLCYYMAPVFVILASPIVLKERLTPKKILCTVLAIIGMTVISGIFQNGSSNITGILLGLGAAILYATVIILNKFIKSVSDYEKTAAQLGSAAIAVLPYLLLTEDVSAFSPSFKDTVLILTVGILHTGVAYALYFGSLSGIKAQTAAIFSYIDPVVALILSALVLKEAFTLANLVGSLLILGSAALSELDIKFFQKKNKKPLTK